MKNILTVFVAVLVAGCGGKGEVATVGVSGIVKVNGKPTAGLDVAFMSEGFTSYGKTDSEGKYRLTKGAVAGSEYKVCISFEGGGSSEADIAGGEDEGQTEAAATGAEAGNGGAKKKSVLVIAPEYSDPEATKLTYTIPADGTESANFDIPASK